MGEKRLRPIIIIHAFCAVALGDMQKSGFAARRASGTFLSSGTSSAVFALCCPRSLPLTSDPSDLCLSDPAASAAGAQLWSMTMTQREMPIFTRTFDFQHWLLPATTHFPLAQRLTVTQRRLDAAFDFSERIEEANTRRGAARSERIHRAAEALGILRFYLRLARRWEWLSAGQYEHVAVRVAELGRLLGGWQKVTNG